MAKPLNNFEFATNTNYSTGPDVGTPTKVAPSAGEIDSGFVRGTAAVAQHVNWLFGEVQEWLEYLAGLATDTEFLEDLEDRDWHFKGEIVVDGGADIALGVSVGGDLEVGDTFFVSGDTTLTGAVTLSSSLTVTGTTLMNGDLTLGAGDNITMASRTVSCNVPLNFSPCMSSSLDAQSWLGAGGVYGFHVFGDTATSLPSVCEFTVPVGASLINVLVGYSAFSAGMELELFRVQNTANANTTTLLDSFTGGGSGAGNTSLSAGAPSAATNETRYRVDLKPSGGVDSTEADVVTYLAISYSSTHVDPND